MSIFAAIFTALAIAVTQLLHGGLFFSAFSIPAMALLVAAAVFSVVPAARDRSAWNLGALIVVAVCLAYLGWRCLFAADPMIGRIELGLVMMAGLTLAVIGGAVTGTRERLWFLGILGIVAAGQAVFGIVQFSQGGTGTPFWWFSSSLREIYEERFATRARGLFLNPNQFSWFMSWAALFALSLAVWGKFSLIKRVLLVYGVLVFVAANVLSGSRGGLLALGVGAGVFFGLSLVAALCLGRRSGTWVVVATTAMLTVCAGVGLWVYSSTWVAQGRVDAIRLPDLRTSLLEHGFRKFQEAPLLGEGPGAFYYAARVYRWGQQTDDAVFAHNDWLQTAVDYGFTGFAIVTIAILAMFAMGAARFIELLRSFSETDARMTANAAAIVGGALASVASFAAHSLTDFNMHVPANALLAAATLGLLAAPIPRGQQETCLGLRLRGLGARALGTLSIVVLAAALGVYGWRNASADYALLRADEALRNERASVAITWAEKGLMRRPTDAALLAKKARSLFALDDEIAFSSSFPPAERTRARQIQRQRAALAAFETAVKLQPRERDHWLGVAEGRLLVRDFPGLDESAIMAISLDPRHPYSYGIYGDLLADVGFNRRAFRIFQVGGQLPEAWHCWQRGDEVRLEIEESARGGPIR